MQRSRDNYGRFPPGPSPEEILAASKRQEIERLATLRAKNLKRREASRKGWRTRKRQPQ